ncbi:hypothetical protein [Nostoc sp.]
MKISNDYKELFIRSVHFINRGFNPAKYLFTTEQFDRVLQSLIDQKNLVFRMEDTTFIQIFNRW